MRTLMYVTLSNTGKHLTTTVLAVMHLKLAKQFWSKICV